jgi:hypothetical protein
MTLVYQNAIGIDLAVATSYNLTGYSTISLIITKPSGTKLTKNPSVTSVALGTLKYETISGDLDESGQYKIQAIVTYGDGDVIKGEIDTFEVYIPL